MGNRSHVLCLHVLCTNANAVADWFEPLAATLGLATFRTYEHSEEPVIELFVDLERRDVAVELTKRIIDASLQPGAIGHASYVGLFPRASAMRA